MTIRLGKYLCGVLLILFTLFVFGHVRADCVTDCRGFQSCIDGCRALQCGKVPDGKYCCEGKISSEQCVTSKKEECSDGCCGIKLNTNFPIIGNCIESANATGAFPMMMGALTKIIMSLILVVCFILIIAAGVLWASAGEDSGKAKTARGIIEKVAITILLLGFSGVILRLINPNFFG